jgi:large subunit ribosomal protein L10
MFSENPKEPALIISSFRKDSNGERPVMKAAFINGDVYMGDNNLVTLTKIKTKNELIGEVIGLLQSPAKRVLAALLHHHEQKRKRKQQRQSNLSIHLQFASGDCL